MGTDRASRVLLCEPAGRGGIFHYSCGLASALSCSGAEVLLVTARDHEPCSVPCAFDVAEVFARCRTSPIELMDIFERFDPDIIHLQTATHPLLHLLLLEATGRLTRATCVVTAHNVGQRYGGRLAEWASRRLYRRAARLIAHSPRLAAQLVARFGLEERRVASIPHGTADHLVQGRAAASLNGRPPSILFFGYIHPSKGLDDLIEAMPRIVARVPSVRLVVAGKPEMETAPLERRTRELGLEGAVEWRFGYADRGVLPDLFGAARLVVLPYRDASQSGVVFLAGAFARPVVATRVGALPEVIEHGRTGLLVAPGDTRALAEAVSDLLSDPIRARSLGDAHRERCRREFGWDGIARRTRALYEEALGAGSSERGGAR